MTTQTDRPRTLRSARPSCVRITALVGLVLGVGAVSSSPAQSPVDRFIASLEGDSAIPAKVRKLIEASWANCQDCDAEEFLTQGLAVLSAPLRAGLEAYEVERYEDCVGAMAELRNDPNPFVAAHAVAYEIKALVALDRLLEVGSRIDAITGERALLETDLAAHSYFAPELAFLRGYSLLVDLQYEPADIALKMFLRDYPKASQRLKIAAEQMVAELANRAPEQIGEVADLMAYAGRRLTHRDTGDQVRTRQQRIVDLLDKLIKEAEDQENSSQSGSSSGGGGGSQGGKSGAQNPGSPMQDSQLPGGSAKNGSLRDRRRASPGELWGSMPPAERARVLQALRENFPSRYRKLVEQYYEELAKKP